MFAFIEDNPLVFKPRRKPTDPASVERCPYHPGWSAQHCAELMITQAKLNATSYEEFWEVVHPIVEVVAKRFRPQMTIFWNKEEHFGGCTRWRQAWEGFFNYTQRYGDGKYDDGCCVLVDGYLFVRNRYSARKFTVEDYRAMITGTYQEPWKPSYSRRPRRDADNAPTALYRHFDHNGRLLYVGVSLAPFKRLGQHRGSHWASLISTVKLETYPNRLAALEGEHTAIVNERPLYNIAGVRSCAST